MTGRRRRAEAGAGRVAVFKIEVTPFSPSVDCALPWVWECGGASPEVEFCGGGSGTSQGEAFSRASFHAARCHGVAL